MDHIDKEQIRLFRLHTHHLDTWYAKTGTEAVVGACGLQNSPPGAWESALHNRIQDYERDEMRKLLEEEKTLLQAWSYRGAPVVFPTAQSDVFLSALVPRGDEPWIYTQGIQLALDLLQMSLGQLLPLLLQVTPKLDGEVLVSKTTLDQTLATWMLPLLPEEKRQLWNRPSLYGNPERQTVGGAVVSFLLRPCAFLGQVVFGGREGISPAFTSYKAWTGHYLVAGETPEQRLVRKYLHCFGPASVSGLGDWLGCSLTQARRMWQALQDEIVPVDVSGKVRYILSEDKGLLLNPPQPRRNAHLLGGHDPYLGLQDREMILEGKDRRRQIWRTVSNPGAVLWRGEVVGMWRSRKKGRRLAIDATLWDGTGISISEIQELSERYAVQQQLKLDKVSFLP